MEAYYQNVRGVRTKIHQLRECVSLNNYSFYVLTETWLNANISSQELGFKNYDVYRSDRNSDTSDKLRGGGVLIAACRTLRSSLVVTSVTSVEHVFVKFRFNNDL